MNKFVFAAIFLISSLYTSAQEISIMDGNVTSCTGFLVDSGLSAGDYGPDENTTITVCPEAPDTIINLNFFIFDLGDGDRRFKSQMRKTMMLNYKKHLLDFQNSSFLWVFYLFCAEYQLNIGRNRF